MTEQLRYFDLLPDEKILEICEQMDLSELNKFIRSNSRISTICQEVINTKKKNILCFLLSILIGEWINCYSGIRGFFFTWIIIEDRVNNIKVS